MAMIYITGAAAAGKTSVVNRLKELLPKERFDIHDIDEADLWTNDYPDWRAAKIDYWLQRAISNEKANIDTILGGIIYPKNVVEAPTYSQEMPVSYFLLDATPEVINERFKIKRPKVPSNRVQRQMEITQELRDAFKDRQDATVLNSSTLSVEELSAQISHQLHN